jgi:MFS family permease
LVTGQPAGTTEPRRGRIGPLRHRNFRLLVIGRTTNSFGSSVTPVALAFAVLDLGGSATELGLVVASFALAEVVTVLAGGVLGDRVSRQRMMQVTISAAAVVQATVAALLVTDVATIPVLAVGGAVLGVLLALAGPSANAIVRLTVPPEELERAVPLGRVFQNGAQIAGFAAGGVLVATIGPGWAIGVDALTFAVAAVCFTLMRVPHTRAEGARPSFLGDLGDGFREVFRHTWLWLLIGQALLYHLIYGGAQGVVGPIVVGEEISRTGWGVALSGLMAGFLVGGLVCLRFRPRHGLWVGTAFLSWTAFFPFAMAFSDQLWVVVLGAFLHGFGLEIFSVNWDLSIQQNVAEDKLARVYSLDLVGSFVMRPLGLALTGPVAEAVGFHRWLVVVGVVMGGSSLLALLSRDVQRLVRNPSTVG